MYSKSTHLEFTAGKNISSMAYHQEDCICRQYPFHVNLQIHGKFTK